MEELFPFDLAAIAEFGSPNPKSFIDGVGPCEQETGVVNPIMVNAFKYVCLASFSEKNGVPKYSPCKLKEGGCPTSHQPIVNLTLVKSGK